MTRAPRIILWVVLAVGSLLVIASSAVLYVGLTESGTNWALQRVRSAVNSGAASSVEWGTLEGTLLTGLEVRDLGFVTTSESGSVEVAIPFLSFSWQPLGLLKYAVVINSLQIDDLAYASDSVAVESPPMTAATLSDMLFGLPVTLELNDLALRNFSFRLNASNFVINSLSGSAALNGNNLRLSDLNVQQQATTVSGNLLLDNSLGAEGEVRWQTRLGELDYSGELTIAGNLQRLELSHGLAQPLQINTSGILVPGFLAGPEFSVDLRHTFVTLDMAAFGQEGIILQQGDIVTAGNPDALSITGSLQAQVRELEPITLNLDALYQPETFTINTVELSSTQIALNASGAMQFSPRSLEVNWTLARLDPGAALPSVRLTEITGEGSVVITSTAEGEQISANVTRIEGLLNELPLGISGMANVVNAQLTALDLQMSSGENALRVTGSAAEMLDLDWEVQAPKLDQLWEGLHGQLAGQGSISGAIATPAVVGHLDGTQISLQREEGEISVQSIRVVADASAARNDITLTIGPVSTRSGATVTQILEQVSFMLEGTPAQHSLAVDAARADMHVALALNGALSGGNWQGSVQSSSLNGSYGNWRQDDQIAISYLDSALMVEEGCWSYSMISLCLQADQPAGGGLNARLDLRNIPLAWLDYETAGTGPSITPLPQALQEVQSANGLTLPPGLHAEGDLDVRASVVNFGGGTWTSLDLALVPANIVLQIDSAEGEGDDATPDIQRFGLEADTIHVNNTADGWVGELELRILKQTANGDLAQGNLSANVTMDANEQIGGELALGFNDLGWLETVVPGMREPYGSVNGTVMVAGTLSSPSFDGRVQLVDAGFALPDYGLSVTDIQLSLQSLDNNAFLLEGRANSGDGALALRTTLSDLAGENKVIAAEITGTDFSVINTDYARANISPQLQLEFENQELTVTGGIILPLLDLDLEQLFATAGPEGVDVSRDIVVINATPDAAIAEDTQSVPVPLHAEISLLLGEDVRLRGYGLNTRLDGELSLEQAPNRPMLVYGELGIPEGSFEIYNQMLNAKDGRLMFFGNPANPTVDIRAFRETNDAEVGMLLSGNIKDMQGELYSSPDLPEAEILALLITGKSFNNVGGQDSGALLGAIANFGLERSEGLTNKVSSKLGFDSFEVEGGATLEDSALGLGKYITPNLLLRYKVGLFDRQSALSIDYNLTERIKLEVETGISQSVEISYTIETD